MHHRLEFSAALAVLLGMSVPSPAQTPVIPYSEAAAHAGETVIVEGVITDVVYSFKSKTTSVNMGGRAPFHVFTAVIFSEVQAQFPDARSWEGRRVRIWGNVKLNHGKPQIVLWERDQIRLME